MRFFVNLRRLTSMENKIIKFVILSLFLAIVLLLPNQSFAKVDPKKCLGAWLFDENGAEMSDDISGKGINGAIKGKPKWNQGKFGMALECDGVDDQVDFGDNDSLDIGTSDVSIVAWIKCAKYTPSGWRDAIAGKLNTTAPRRGYTYGVRGSLDATNQDKPVTMMGLASDSGITLYGTKPINDDTWHHVAMSCDRDGNMVFYRDGELEAQVSIANKANENENTTQSFVIGAGSGGGFLKSLIDEVAVFNVALTQDEIKNIMNRGLARELGSIAVSNLDKLATTWSVIKCRN
jgi:hypothetical protein